MRGLIPLSNQSIDEALNSNRDLIAPPASFAYLIALKALHKSVLVITASSKLAEDLAKEIKECHPDTLEFPAWETLPHERLSPSSDTVAKRISTLQARRLTPLIRMASEPQTPCAQERRKVSVPSR